jgi:hypothetical protein
VTTTDSQNGRTAGNDPDELRREIEVTRAELGETVEALAQKADIKGRAQDSVEHAKLRVREGVEQAKVNAAQLGREFRADPMGELRVAAQRVQRSVVDNPRPWAIAAAFLVLAMLLRARRRPV